jgi:flagellar hook-length control protein FliK
MAMSGAAAFEVNGLNNAPNQKPASSPPAESFAAFLDSAPGRLAQKDAPSPGTVTSLQGQGNSTALTKSLTNRTALPGQQPARKPANGNPSAESQTAAAQTSPPSTMTLVQPLSAVASSTTPPTASSQDAEAGKKLCETPEYDLGTENAATIASGTQVPGMVAPGMVPPGTTVPVTAAPSAPSPIAISPQIAAPLQAAASPSKAALGSEQRVAGRKTVPSDGSSTAADSDQDGNSANLPIVQLADLSDQPATAVALSSASSLTAAKTSAIDPGISNTVPGDTSLSNLISVAGSNPPAQPAGIEAVAASTVPLAPAPLNSAATAGANRAVALRISRAIASGEDTLTIDLHPAELGHVAVKLAFHGNSVDVQMVVGRQETFQAFNQDRAALEQQFSQAGINLGSGGLDLRYSQTPTTVPEQTGFSGSLQSDDGASDPQARTIFLGDNLVNIIA